jgi:predicted Zn-dependent peptidase
MRRTLLPLVITLTVSTAGAQPRGIAVDIPYEQFTLPNGLRVLVHTDRKAPIVAVNIWYHVGSKEEPSGRSGFAHLFEHLMFQGSENHKGEFFVPFELVGATDQNGTTNTDRTNYFENVPTTALDVALWMESDRMGHLLGALDQGLLDEQRGVVQNEKRQGENNPYGQAFTLIAKATYPEGHPYHHTTIGSMNDLNAATLDDVKNWFKSWYGPNNAVLVLAGDIDLATAKDKVTKYFGDLKPSATVPKLKPQIAPRTTATRESAVDNVPQTRIYKLWNVPQFGSVENTRLDLLQVVLGGSQSSRLARRLKFADKSVDRVSSFVASRELAGQLGIQVDVKPGVDASAVDKAIDEEIAKLIAEGPTAAEVDQARASLQAQFVRGIERIGGFGGKSDALAMCTVFTGKPMCYRDQLATIASATPAQLKEVAAKWIAKGAYTLQVDPGQRKPLVEDPTPQNLPPTTVAAPDARLKALPSTLDRSTGVPKTETFPPLRWPTVAKAKLANGLDVLLVERHGAPIVQMSMEFHGAGYAADKGRKPGTTGFSLAMLDEGAGSYDALAYAARKEALGATIDATGTLDIARVQMFAMKPRLDDSLALYADVILRPRLDATDIERVRGNWLAQIKQEKARPSSLLRRLVAPALYGADHPYGIAPTGTGTEQGISALSRDDLTKWLAEWIRPDNATLIVVGDTDLAELRPKLEKAFASWKAPGTPLARPALPAVRPAAKSRVLLVDQPGASQANIMVAELVPASTDAGAIELEMANGVLGGQFSSRLNMNLREDKHWSYGSYSNIGGALGQRVWAAVAPVQIDKTAESIKEMRREVTDYITAKAPAKPEELSRLQATEVRRLPGAFETGRAILGTLSDIVTYGRPDDYVQQRATKVSGLTIDQLKKAAATIQPPALTWIIVGDLKKIEGPVRNLGLGEVKVVDPDGHAMR